MIKTLKCIFCQERYANSKEHIRADWMNNLIPYDGLEHTHHKFFVDMRIPGGVVVGGPREDRIKVPYGRRKLKIVCGECNNGWMSRLQSGVREILAPMIRGKKINLSLEKQNIIVNWSIMTTIVNEYTGVETKGIPASEAFRFYKERSASRSWRVWAGDNMGRNNRYHHRAAVLGDIADPAIHGTFQSTSATYGSFFLHTFYSDLEDCIEGYDRLMKSVKCIVALHPHQDSIDWPPYIPITNDDIDGIVNGYYMGMVGHSIEKIKDGMQSVSEFQKNEVIKEMHEKVNPFG